MAINLGATPEMLAAGIEQHQFALSVGMPEYSVHDAMEMAWDAMIEERPDIVAACAVHDQLANVQPAQLVCNRLRPAIQRFQCEVRAACVMLDPERNSAALMILNRAIADATVALTTPGAA